MFASTWCSVLKLHCVTYIDANVKLKKLRLRLRLRLRDTLLKLSIVKLLNPHARNRSRIERGSFILPRAPRGATNERDRRITRVTADSERGKKNL